MIDRVRIHQRLSDLRFAVNIHRCVCVCVWFCILCVVRVVLHRRTNKQSQWWLKPLQMHRRCSVHGECLQSSLLVCVFCSKLKRTAQIELDVGANARQWLDITFNADCAITRVFLTQCEPTVASNPSRGQGCDRPPLPFNKKNNWARVSFRPLKILDVFWALLCP